nr:zinc finger BED domain-containing protein RICESLEEPER 2-like [Tanacetum cinerariifolium]
MAMDIISVQASLVASESAFSTSGRVLSIRRTRLTPASLEIYMCLNDHLDSKERKQDKCPLEIPLDFEEDVFDDEMQLNEAISLYDEDIALDASSKGTLSLGGPRDGSQRLNHSSFATFDLLGFWKANLSILPVLSRMDMDIISVQATLVASESAFSTSGRVLSIRRTRLTPPSLKMCMCLNDHLDAKERKQDKCPLEIPLDFEEVVFDDEMQRNEAISLSDEEIAVDTSSEGTLSPGGP